MDSRKRELIDKYWAHQKVAKVEHALMALTIEIHGFAETVIEHAHAYVDASKEADIVAHEMADEFPHRTANTFAEGVWTQLFQTIGMQMLRGSWPPPLTPEEEEAASRARSDFMATRKARREAEAAQAEKPPADPEKK